MHSLELVRSEIEAACQRVGRNSGEVTLIGASKTVPPARLEEFFEAGLRDFGENYVQEGIEKVRYGRERGWDATWHFIGALQSNKAREAVAHFDWIHSVDRLSLARELDKEARRIGKIQRVLLQVNIGEEESKAGCAPENLGVLLDSIAGFENLKVEGLMSLPPMRENPQDSRVFHQQLRALRDSLASDLLPLASLSMGMSRDFPIALEEGATLVRVGSAIFGTRS